MSAGLNLAGQVHVVLGAGQGIGEQIVLALAGAGARVVCVDLDAERAERVAEAVGGFPVVADVTDRAELVRVREVTLRSAGGLHGVVDVVGTTLWRPLLDLTDADWSAQLAVSLQHAVLAVQELVPAMTEGGAVTLIASLAAHGGAPGAAFYGIAKAGMVSLVRSAAVELGPAGVRVNAVSPGYTRTTRSRPVTPEQAADMAARVPLGRVGLPADVASVVLFLQSGLAGFVTGQAIAVDGGVSALPAYGTTPGAGRG